ncbi:MAG: hypothetical protein H0T15_07630 [Thermoleophilaceae bacterium]|nr:hypothetical protein [Thermoleophilaceae bacterium]
MSANLRSYGPGDRPGILALWERCGDLPVASDGLTADQALDLMASPSAVTVVAERDGGIVAACVATATGPLAFFHRLSVPPAEEGDELAGQVLELIEETLRARGVERFAVMAQEGEERRRFEERGFERVGVLRYLERSA